MKTQKITHVNKVERTWHEIDASKETVGRVATRIASLLRGKGKRTFSPHMDMGDYVVALNVDKLKLSGRKLEQKQYFRHSGYLGGLKTEDLKTLMNKKPEEVLKRAVFSMLDEVKFRKAMMARLKLVKGSEHNFAQLKK
ncbi:MAG TPA: 50S ribosomal protein L13 [Patescibacteria group bacterium]|nr:50S ribosomal protein L13 [Patescibacteria group bacterium]